MSEIVHIKAADITPKYKNEHSGYEYFKRELVPKGYGEQSVVSLYEIPPGQAAYPYHYHTKNEESFYIISGEGLLKTPLGERSVSAGDFLFFPANESGAHKLTNASEKEMLRYMDFDTNNDVDVVIYPNSGKIGIFGKGINKVYRITDEVNYYDNE